MVKAKVVLGSRYDEWTVVSKAPGVYKYGCLFWICRCSCGAMHTVAGGNLLCGGSLRCRSCSSKRANPLKALRRPPGLAGWRAHLRAHRGGAKRRGLVDTLTDEQIYALTQGNCYFCGAPPSKIRLPPPGAMDPRTKAHGSFVYNGIDRYDNRLGYTFENSKSCCWPCNQLKRTVGGDDFIAKCRLIAETHGKS